MNNTNNTNKYMSLKYIIIGESGVGKSCLVGNLIGRNFNSIYNSTIGVEYATYDIYIDDTKIKIQIWDMAGQERFRSITRAFYRSASCALLVFDVCDMNSFDNIKYWIDEIRNNCGDFENNKITKIILVGNKCDMENRKISFDEATNFAKINDIDYIETSAKTGYNVENAFTHFIKKYFSELNIYGLCDEKSKYIKINNKKDVQKQQNQIFEYCTC